MTRQYVAYGMVFMRTQKNGRLNKPTSMPQAWPLGRVFFIFSGVRVRRNIFTLYLLVMHFLINSFVLEPLPKFEAVGCYKDSSSRALPTLYANFRPFIDWYNMNATIRQCALVARDMGYKYFAVQFYGECWSSWDASENYDKYDKQTKTTYCWANVGGPMTNYVYRFPYVSI